MRMLKPSEGTSIAIGSGLLFANIILMWLLTYTPIPSLTLLLFKYLIVGVLAFTGVLWLGNWLATRGIASGQNGLAIAGVSILQIAYGAFGSSVLIVFAKNTWIAGLVITAGITAAITAIVALFVFMSNKNFSQWGKYASYVFMAAIVSALIGTFVTTFFYAFTFFLVVTGFFIYLVYEIWSLKAHPKNILLNAFGLYVAVMGIFLHILQIVMSFLSQRDD